MPEHSAQTVRVGCLSVLASPDRAAEGCIHLLGAATYVGREPAERELVWIADPALEIRHCRVLREPDGYTIEDLETHSGTALEGEWVTRRRMSPGDILRAGDTLFAFGELDLTAARWAHDPASGLVGRSPNLVHILDRVPDLAASPAPILVSGPKGSGKERIAWELHRQSGRGGPFLSYDCGATPAEMHEADLLGAASAQAGLVQRAAGGTLLLQRVRHLAPDLLRRVLRAGARGSSDAGRRAALVFGAARPRDLPADQRAPLERLARRVADRCLALAPLGERREDILPLTLRFLEAARSGRRRHLTPAPVLLPDLQERLLVHPWPGNADELRSLVQRMVLVGHGVACWGPEMLEKLAYWLGPPRPKRTEGPTTRPELEPWPAVGALPPPPPLGTAATRQDLERLLAAFGGSVKRVALYLGRDRSLIYRWLRKSGLR